MPLVYLDSCVVIYLIQGEPPIRRAVAAALTPEGEKKIASPRGTINKVMTPERQELIRGAMKIHRAKMKILDDLSDEDKKKLYVAAVKAFLREDKGKN